ncbi:substrate-binding domain-containing protein [Streptomyces sp. NPDC007818]|uniref:substrate-binding domain-containing protein n=1 Tax=Streptomyces sp. NPDC007818 TaxID=3364780 RepID=UPI0036970B4D
MLSTQRRDVILRSLRRDGSVQVSELATQLNVSQMTVRRDVGVLVEQGLAVRVHGGVTLPQGNEIRHPKTQGTTPGLERPVLGMVVPDASQYYRQVIQGARHAAHAQGLRLTLGVSCYEPAEDLEQARQLIDAGVDGLLLTPSEPLAGPPADLAWITELPVPVVLVERRRSPYASLDRLDHVTSDHIQGAMDAACHLATLGHTRIALLSRITPNAQLIADGLDLAEKICDLQPGAPRLHNHSPQKPGALSAFLEEVLASGTTAVLAHPDAEAIALLDAARHRGLSVPEDLSITAYDDEVASLAPVPLTAVAPPRHEVGRLAVELLARRLEEKARRLELWTTPQQTLLSPRVVVRSSTAEPRRQTS